MIQRRFPTGLRGRLILAFTFIIFLSVFMASGATLALHARSQVERGRREMAVQAITLANLMAETQASATAEDPPRFLDVVRLILADARLRRGRQPLLLTDNTGRPIFSLNLPSDDDGRGGAPRGVERAPDRERDPRFGSSPPGGRAGFPGPPRPNDGRAGGDDGAERTRASAEDRERGTAAAASASDDDEDEGRTNRPGGDGRFGFGFGFGRPSQRNPISPPHVSPELRFVPAGLTADGEPAIASIETAVGAELLYTSVPLPSQIEPERWMYFGRADLLEPPLQLVIIRPSAELRGLWRPLLPSVALVGSLAMALATLIAIAIARSITRPLEALTQASERMRAGDYDVRVDAGGAKEIDVLASAFNDMAHAVGEADRRQREFVANVGHDLRTPLTSIGGFASALLDGTAQQPEQRQRAIEAIASAGTRMSDLVEALLELARLDGQANGMRMVDTPVEALLRKSFETYGHLAEAKALQVDIRAEVDRVHADPIWMTSALGNVIDNAIQHSPDGGRLQIAATAGPVYGSGSGSETPRRDGGGEAGAAAPATEEPGVVIEVVDEGPGISDEDRDRVFERFYRADRSRKAGGSGLGLAIVHEIVKAHGGSIEIRTAEGGGTRVIIALPNGDGPAA